MVVASTVLTKEKLLSNAIKNVSMSTIKEKRKIDWRHPNKSN